VAKVSRGNQQIKWNQQMTTNASRDDELMRLWGQLSASVLQRGLEFARLDDVNNYAVATRMLHSPGAALELRMSMRTGSMATTGYVVDQDGEPLARLFEITARPAA
jgi:hypothetical protein